MNKSQETLNQIIDSATTVFIKKGYEQTKIADIADEANISKGLLYFYFDNKEDLFLAVMANRMNEVVDFFEDFIHYSKGNLFGIDRMITYVRSHLHFTMEMPNYHHLAYNFFALKGGSSHHPELASNYTAWVNSIHYEGISMAIRRAMKLGVDFIDDCLREEGLKDILNPMDIYNAVWVQLIGLETMKQATSRMPHDPDFKDMQHLHSPAENYIEMLVEMFELYLRNSLDRKAKLAQGRTGKQFAETNKDNL